MARDKIKIDLKTPYLNKNNSKKVIIEFGGKEVNFILSRVLITLYRLPVKVSHTSQATVDWFAMYQQLVSNKVFCIFAIIYGLISPDISRVRSVWTADGQTLMIKLVSVMVRQFGSFFMKIDIHDISCKMSTSTRMNKSNSSSKYKHVIVLRFIYAFFLIRHTVRRHVHRFCSSWQHLRVLPIIYF